MLRQIQRVAPPEAYIERMKYPDHQTGDVVMISGVGRVYSLYAQSQHPQ